MKRQIIRIDESKCTGCGLCVPNCAEGSLEIRNGKAVLVKEALCDGLGACLGHCPEGALTVEERDADAFDEVLVEHRLEEIGRKPHAPAPHEAPAPGQAHGTCPGSAAMRLGPRGGCPSAQVVELTPRARPAGQAPAFEMASELTQWPVQLGLLPPNAPFFQGADLMLVADCVPFAYPNFHRDFLRGNAVAVACPKLDNAGAHFQKLIQLFRQGGLKSVAVVRMEVPCCGGLTALATDALRESGADLALREVIVGRDGNLRGESPARPAVGG
jgi:NAD-dependent dihydropyrimidine dehydrogenase PreA subunit